AWSPDGRFIGFAASAGPGTNSAAYVISVDERKLQRLPGNGFSEWSRDGKWIYVSSAVGGMNQVRKIPWPFTGQVAVPVNRKPEIGIESYDGKFVYYLRGQGEGVNSLWRAPVDGGEETQVLPSVLNNNWTIAAQGIYFVPPSRTFPIQFLNFADRKV